MKNIFIFFLFSISMFSQKSGIAYYGIMLSEYKDKNGKNDDMLSEAKKIAENQNFILEFNEVQSHFYFKDEMKNENVTDLIKGVAIILSGNENYYDNSKHLSINKHVDGVLLKDRDSIKTWEIKKETKMIGDYLCYKAEYTKKYKGNNNTEKSKLITAWFAPSLPLPFGPNGYNGLPGLILELIENGNKSKRYFLKSVELKKMPLEIKFPKDKVITEDEYLKNSSYIPR